MFISLTPLYTAFLCCLVQWSICMLQNAHLSAGVESDFRSENNLSEYCRPGDSWSTSMKVESGILGVSDMDISYIYFSEEIQETRPLVFFIGGGPGVASTLGIFRFGPCDSNGDVNSSHDLTRDADVVFVDIYEGTGHSSTLSGNGVAVGLGKFTSNFEIAELLHQFITVFLHDKNIHSGRIVHLYGQSYAGQIVSQLLKKVNTVPREEGFFFSKVTLESPSVNVEIEMLSFFEYVKTTSNFSPDELELLNNDIEKCTEYFDKFKIIDRSLVRRSFSHPLHGECVGNDGKWPQFLINEFQEHMVGPHIGSMTDAQRDVLGRLFQTDRKYVAINTKLWTRMLTAFYAFDAVENYAEYIIHHSTSIEINCLQGDLKRSCDALQHFVHQIRAYLIPRVHGLYEDASCHHPMDLASVEILQRLCVNTVYFTSSIFLYRVDSNIYPSIVGDPQKLQLFMLIGPSPYHIPISNIDTSGYCEEFPSGLQMDAGWIFADAHLAMSYVYFFSEEDRPLIFFLAGGPGGASTLGIFKYGPCDHNREAISTSLTKVADVVFVDYYEGSGASSTVSTGIPIPGGGAYPSNYKVAKTLYNFIKGFLKEKNVAPDTKLILFGESYAGQVVSQLVRVSPITFSKIILESPSLDSELESSHFLRLLDAQLSETDSLDEELLSCHESVKGYIELCSEHFAQMKALSPPKVGPPPYDSSMYENCSGDDDCQNLFRKKFGRTFHGMMEATLFENRVNPKLLSQWFGEYKSASPGVNTRMRPSSYSFDNATYVAQYLQSGGVVDIFCGEDEMLTSCDAMEAFVEVVVEKFPPELHSRVLSITHVSGCVTYMSQIVSTRFGSPEESSPDLGKISLMRVSGGHCRLNADLSAAVYS